MTEPRWNLIRRLREQIARGTYVTEAKIRITADRAVRALGRSKVEQVRGRRKDRPTR
jgi:hypothetical protein